MKEYLFAYFTPPNKYGNLIYTDCSKSEAIKSFNEQFEKSIILNIIDL